VSDPSSFDVSDNSFQITDVPAPAVRIISPNGGEKYRVGVTVTVSWDTTNTQSVRWKLEVGKAASGPWRTLADNVKDSAGNRGRALVVFRQEDVSTTAYVRMSMVSDPTKNDASDASFTIEAPQQAACDSVIRGEINNDIRLHNTKAYCLDGYVYVNSGATIHIEKGTIIMGDTVGQNSVLCINRGAKIMAEGTKDLPIIMTSSAKPGQRARGDWGGVVICGRARTNHPGGEAAIEGGIADPTPGKGWFGGTNDDDNSGILKYVRIEFAGIAVLPNNELNGLTMGGVGRGTMLDYIQVSHGNDDAFEWFGGTVNAKHLIATGALDDCYDTDNGYRGNVQFAVSQRFRLVADQSTSQAFESDNDASASYNTPRTSGVFSNVTCIGPLQDTSWTIGNGPKQYNTRFGAAVQIRRASLLNICNSVFMGWTRGLEIAQTPTMVAANGDSLQFRNNSLYGIKGTVMNNAGGTPPAGFDATWIEKPAFGNIIDKSSPNVAMLENPFATDNTFNPVPKRGSPVLTGAKFEGATADTWFERVVFRGAFGMERWDADWTEYDPVNAIYTVQDPSDVREEGGIVMDGITGNATPNPAYDYTKIRYVLNADDVITIRVVDLTGGDLKATYIEGEQQHAGTYEFNVITSDLGSGVYYVTVTGNKGSLTIPVTVVH
jgi:hypothetical protein